MHEVLRQHIGRGAVQFFGFIQVQVVGANFEQVRTALENFVGQPRCRNAHQREQRILPFLEIGLPELEFDSAELSLQDPDEEITAAARWLRKRESIRSVSSFTRSSIASTIQGGVNTSPWSATRFFDLIRFKNGLYNNQGSIPVTVIKN